MVRRMSDFGFNNEERQTQNTKEADVKNFSAGMRVICRDAEWLVTRVETINSSRDKALYCAGADDFTGKPGRSS